MMNLTHGVLAVTAAAIGLGTADPLVLLLAGVASQLPDVDTSSSVPGRILLPVSRYLEKRYAHRSVTHSFLATAVFAVLVLPVVLLGQAFWWGLVIGYFMGWFGDCFTKSGVAAFFPSSARLVIPGNPRLRLSTNSPAEYFVLGVLVIVAIGIINLNSSGGILRGFNQLLGLPSGAVEIVSLEGSRYQIFVQVSGRVLLTQQPFEQELEVVRAMTDSDLLTRDRTGRLYRVGTTQSCEIVANRMTTRRGRPIRVQTESVQMEDEAISEKVPASTVSDRTYITGTLTLEDAEDLSLPTYPDRFDSMTLQPGQGVMIVRLESASPVEVRVLGDYYGTGSLIVRTVEVL